jgi:hypothetical protein
VWLVLADAGFVGVLVVLIVNVHMVVVERFVTMHVFVALAQQESYTERHECSSREVSDREGLGEDQWREQGADEWCDREYGGFACGPETAECEGVEVDAEPIADGAEKECHHEQDSLREVFTDDDGEDHVDGSRDAGLDAHDRARVTNGEGLGEVVVDGPSGTGGGDEQDAEPVGASFAGADAEYERAGEDDESAGDRLAGEVFAKQHDADDDRERSFEVQQQGPGDAGNAFETQEQQDGCDDAAGGDHNGHARRVGTTESCFRARARSREAQGDEGAEVEESGEHLRGGVVEQSLREGRADPERQRGREPEEDSPPGC